MEAHPAALPSAMVPEPKRESPVRDRGRKAENSATSAGEGKAESELTPFDGAGTIAVGGERMFSSHAWGTWLSSLFEPIAIGDVLCRSR